MVVLGLRGWESPKIWDGLKVQDIDKIQSHYFNLAERANYSFTLESNMICKPIQWELFSLSDQTDLSVFSIFVNRICVHCPYLLQKDRNIMSHVVTFLHISDFFTQWWLLCTAVNILHAAMTVLHDSDSFISGNIVARSYCLRKDGVFFLHAPIYVFLRFGVRVWIFCERTDNMFLHALI